MSAREAALPPALGYCARRPPTPLGSAVVSHARKMMDIEAAPVHPESAPLLGATSVETPAWRRRIAVGASIFGTVGCAAPAVAGGEFRFHETRADCPNFVLDLSRARRSAILLISLPSSRTSLPIRSTQSSSRSHQHLPPSPRCRQRRSGLGPPRRGVEPRDLEPQHVEHLEPQHVGQRVDPHDPAHAPARGPAVDPAPASHRRVGHLHQLQHLAGCARGFAGVAWAVPVLPPRLRRDGAAGHVHTAGTVPGARSVRGLSEGVVHRRVHHRAARARVHAHRREAEGVHRPGQGDLLSATGTITCTRCAATATDASRSTRLT